MGKWKQEVKRARETANIYADNLERMTDLAAILQNEVAELKQAEAAFNLAIENAQAEIVELKIALAEKSQIIRDVALYIDAIADRNAKQGKCSRVQSKIGAEAGEVCNRNQCQGLMIRHRSYFYCNVCDVTTYATPSVKCHPLNLHLDAVQKTW